MKQLKKICKKSGLDHLMIQSVISDEMRIFCERKGFTASKITPDDYLMEIK